MAVVSKEQVKLVLARYQDADTERTPWLNIWQLISEYIDGRSVNFTGPNTPGQFLLRDIFDNTGIKSARTMVSAIIGMLWPNGAKSIRIIPSRGVKDTQAHRDYYAAVTERLTQAFDDPEANFVPILEEVVGSAVKYGTGAIEVMKGDDCCDLHFRQYSLKEIRIAQGANGVVDTVYILREYSVHRAVAEYGFENLSPKVQELFRNQKYNEKIQILIALEPNLMYDKAGKQNNRNRKYRSMHIEMAGEFVIRQSGFEKPKIRVPRFWKNGDETYGRSPGIDAIPDILELNIIWEGVTVAIEKMLDPPMGMLHDGILGGGTVDTSAGAINIFNITGRAGERQPIFPLYVVQELQHVVQLIEKLTESLTNHFYIDRLLDLNNEKEMTFGESRIRERIRAHTLGTLFARCITELFNPVVMDGFDRLFEDGKLGVIMGSPMYKKILEKGEEPIIIPEDIAKRMAKGQEFYQIKYITPAARAMEAEDAQAIIGLWEQLIQMAPVIPQATDGVDIPASIQEYARITGVPVRIMLAADKILENAKARMDAQKEAQQQENANTAADTAQKLAGAAQTAGLTPQQGPEQRKR